MKSINRRQFIASAAVLSCAAPLSTWTEAEAAEPDRRMTMCLSPGAIGVSADQVQAIKLAHQFGFESVEPSPDYLSKLSDSQVADLVADLKSKGLVFGTAGLPLDFRRDELHFKDSLKHLPDYAASLQRAGVTRWGTWLTPSENSKTYLENFKVHARRLREAAQIFKDHGQRVGLEYVGTTTARANCRFPFIHSLPEMKDLMAEIGTGNVGLILDSWHWWQAGDSVADLAKLTNEDVVSVDLNDAPLGVRKDEQQDGRRELPVSTGVIDAGGFLNSLNQIGYDGPVRAEPFNKRLNDLDNDAACAETIAALKKAFALIKT